MYGLKIMDSLKSFLHLLREIITSEWIFKAILSVVAMLLAYPLSPIVLLFQNGGRLPKGFRWLETQDNPLIGDSGHIERWKAIRAAHPMLNHDYFQEVAWLWRNKAYSFSYYQLGKVPSDLKLYGNLNVENSGLQSQEGVCYWVGDNIWGVFSFTPIIEYSPGKFLYLRTYLGWKCKGYTPETKKRAMLAFNISFRLRTRIYDNYKA